MRASTGMRMVKTNKHGRRRGRRRDSLFQREKIKELNIKIHVTLAWHISKKYYGFAKQGLTKVFDTRKCSEY
jgi:hypothetical protein